LWVKATRPIIAFYDWCAQRVVRALGVEPKTELENTVSMVELSEMIAESLSEGLLDQEEHMRLSRALQIRNRVVNDVAVPLAEIYSVPLAADESGPTVFAIEQALEHTGYSRFPIIDAGGDFIGFVHIKDILDQIDEHDAVVDGAVVRPLPRVPGDMPLPDALSQLRRNNSHLALVTDGDQSVCAMVTLEDLVEDLIGTVRDGMHRE
jgi:CBS domain containing-hemolysin-like protein